VGKARKLFGAMCGRDGSCAGLNIPLGMGWSISFLLLCLVSRGDYCVPTPGTKFNSTVCSELVTAEMRSDAYPTVTSPARKTSPGAHEAEEAPVATTALGSDESRRNRYSFFR